MFKPRGHADLNYCPINVALSFEHDSVCSRSGFKARSVWALVVSQAGWYVRPNWVSNWGEIDVNMVVLEPHRNGFKIKRIIAVSNIGCLAFPAFVLTEYVKSYRFYAVACVNSDFSSAKVPKQGCRNRISQPGISSLPTFHRFRGDTSASIPQYRSQHW